MVDLTIRGAGIFGLSIAWVALQRGARVRVVDPFGVAAGASGGIVGALAPHTPELWNNKKAFQFESLIAAESFWSGVDAVSGRSSGYSRHGRLQPIADAHGLELAKIRIDAAATLWQGKADWRVIAANQSQWEPSSPTGFVIHDTLSAHLHPHHATQSLAEAIRNMGGEIVTEADDQGPVVWATGYQGLAQISGHFDRPLGSGVKGQAALVRFDARNLPQIFTEGLHFVPHNDGTVAIGSTSEREFQDPQSTDTLLDDVLIRARRALPLLRDAPVIQRWAGVRPRAKNRAPMLGPWPDRPGHFIANGGFKIGFGMAPKLAQTMAALILDQHDAIPDDFRVQANF